MILSIYNDGKSIIVRNKMEESFVDTEARTILFDILKEDCKEKEVISSVIDFCFIEDHAFSELSPLQKLKYYPLPNYNELSKDILSISYSPEYRNTTVQQFLYSVPNGKLRESAKMEDVILLENYEISSGPSAKYTIAYILFIKLLTIGSSIKKCDACGNYFLPSRRSDELFCSDKCRKAIYNIRINRDNLLMLYNKEYKRKYAQIRKITSTSKKEAEKQKLSKWGNVTRCVIQYFKERSLSEDGFKEWIDISREIDFSIDEKVILNIIRAALPDISKLKEWFKRKD